MNKMLTHLNGYKREAVLAPLFKMLEATFDLFVPLVMADIVNVGIAAHDFHYILVRCGILLLLAVVGLACSLTAQYFSAKAAVGYSTSLRHALFEHIQRLGFTEMDTMGTSTLITRMTSDINQVQSGLNLFLRLFLRSPFVVVGAGRLDLCGRHPAAERGGVRGHGHHQPAVQNGPGPAGPCAGPDPREPDRCACGPRL